jgi:hypothetical protein
MDQDKRQEPAPHEPKGFSPRSSGLASEYAREQGWGLNEAERSKPAEAKQDYDGGTDYDYGPADFGDTATNTSSDKPSAPIEGAVKPANSKPATPPGEPAHPPVAPRKVIKVFPAQSAAGAKNPNPAPPAPKPLSGNRRKSA